VTAAVLSPDLAAKLVKVLGRLGSDYDGEVATAGRKAHALIKGAGLTWDEVINPAALAKPKPEPSRPQRRWREPVSPSDCAALCLLWREVLTDWEVDFCRSLVGRQRLSPKQTAVLARIAAKVEAFARATGEC
jgi:hypothetical protein